MVSLFFSRCGDPGRFKEGKKEGEKKTWEMTFSFYLFIL